LAEAAIALRSKFLDQLGENSTTASARVTIIFTKMKARYVVAESGEILEAIDEEC